MHTEGVSPISKGPASLVWGQQLPTPRSKSGAALGEVGRGLLRGRPQAPNWPWPPQDSASSLEQPHPAEARSLLLGAWPASGMQPGMFLSIQPTTLCPLACQQFLFLQATGTPATHSAARSQERRGNHPEPAVRPGVTQGRLLRQLEAEAPAE